MNCFVLHLKANSLILGKNPRIDGSTIVHIFKVFKWYTNSNFLTGTRIQSSQMYTNSKFSIVHIFKVLKFTRIQSS